MLEDVASDNSLDQAVNAATLPGVVGYVVVMPDMHQGYGFPIGGIAATRYPSGAISPGAIGYDINCGVRLLASGLEYAAVENHLDELASALNSYCPSGVGEKGAVRLTEADLEEVCREGSSWALRNGYASEADLLRTEERGKLEGADPAKVSKRAKERGRPQLGTLGAGNHFIEVDVIEQIFHPEAGARDGLGGGLPGSSNSLRLTGISGTRFVRITWIASRTQCAVITSTCPTESWFVHRWILRKVRATRLRCAVQQIMPSRTGSCWHPWRGRLLRALWREKSRAGTCTRCMT